MGRSRHIEALMAIVVMCGAMTATHAVAAPFQPLTKSEIRVCEDLDFCVDLMLRHDPNEFDYSVLAQEFQRLGPWATARLLSLVKGNRESAAQRAQIILSQRGWRFTPAEQGQIARLWPTTNPTQHAAIMANIPSPMMRNRLIETLGDKDAQVRNLSRDTLAEIVRRPTKEFPLPPQAYATLARALLDKPTPTLVDLMAQYPDDKSRPILERVLLSGDSLSVAQSYAALYAQNPKVSFEILLGTLPKLETPEQALALSAMLRARHKDRADGFYLKFARDIAADADLPMLARMVGVDAVMADLSDKPVLLNAAARPAFEFTIAQADVNLRDYARNFRAKTGDNAAHYMSLIWAKIDPTQDPVKERYVTLAGEIAGPDTTLILRDALRDKSDWRVTRAAALALGKRQDKASIAPLSAMSKTHPIVDVRAAALAALGGIKSGKIDFSSTYKASLAASTFCDVDGQDFKQAAQQMPFFDTAIVIFPPRLFETSRGLLSAAAPSEKWLACWL
ncbi:HEAT repeat domain-containing protein [Litorimonas sp. RW-G-Af-16]|uniref:HEAT repeat domain-containing protein n=1 Tax=Litorimonas sp. RW-G-Af-16 TaxID=3241168 RepID=UPI003AB0EA75